MVSMVPDVPGPLTLWNLEGLAAEAESPPFSPKDDYSEGEKSSTN